MKCEICGKEFEKRHWGGEFKNICSDECFGEKFLNKEIEAEE